MTQMPTSFDRYQTAYKTHPLFPEIVAYLKNEYRAKLEKTASQMTEVYEAPEFSGIAPGPYTEGGWPPLSKMR